MIPSSPSRIGRFLHDASADPNADPSFFYSDNDGDLIQGGVTIDHGVLVHDFTVAEAKGTTSKVQARVTFSGPNTYTNEILRWKDEKWEKFVTVRYQRSPN